MSRFDDLPPDLRATLSLLLDRGKSYAEIADMLAIPESAVRARAHAALDALSAVPGRPAATQTAAGGRPPRTAAGPATATPPTSAAPTRGRTSPAAPASRRGGALLLLALLAVIVVVVVLVTSGGGGGSSSKGTTSASAPAPSSTATTASTSPSSTKQSTTAGKPNEDKRLTLTSPDPSSKAIGAVEILSEGGKYAYYIAATNLPASKGFFYAVWLYNSPTSHEAVSSAPTVGSNGHLQGGALLPADAGKYHEMLLTRETSRQPSQPGPIVLKGAFALH
jgi:Sigma-70, region 4